MGTSSESWVTVKPHGGPWKTDPGYNIQTIYRNRRNTFCAFSCSTAAYSRLDKSNSVMYDSLFLPCQTRFFSQLSPIFQLLTGIKAFVHFTRKWAASFYSLIARTSSTASAIFFWQTKRLFHFLNSITSTQIEAQFTVKRSWWDTSSVLESFWWTNDVQLALKKSQVKLYLDDNCNLRLKKHKTLNEFLLHRNV